MSEVKRPLEGVKVLELATFIAAPCCARFLADLGAEVIKLEKVPAARPWKSSSPRRTSSSPTGGRTL